VRDLEDTLVADLLQYLFDTTAERSLDLRIAVAGAPGYVPYSSNFRDAWALQEEEWFEEAKHGRTWFYTLLMNTICPPSGRVIDS
jgi:hypothetical protein